MFKKQLMAFPCMTEKGCPKAALQPGSEGFCPAWRETAFMETNVATMTERAVRGCFFDVQFQALEHLLRASNRPAAEMSAMRASVAAAVTRGVGDFMERLEPELVRQALAQAARSELMHEEETDGGAE